MPKFDAAKAVPTLDWDFRPYVEASGTSPEPTSEALYEFLVDYRNLVEGATRTKSALAVKEAERMRNLSPEEKEAEVERWASMTWQEGAEVLFDELSKIAPSKEILEFSDKQAELVDRVFQSCPSKEQINALPGRIKAAYFGWVQGELTNPEHVAADTKD